MDYIDDVKLSLWENGIAGLAILAEDGRFLEVNPSYCEFVGYTRSELLHKRFQDITHPDDVRDDSASAAAVARGEIPSYTMWKKYLHKRGHSVWVKLKVTRTLTPLGDFGFFLAQVVPNWLVEQKVVSSDAAGHVIPAEVDQNILSFAKANWKWLISFLLAGLGGLLTLHYQLRSALDSIEHLEQQQERAEPSNR